MLYLTVCKAGSAHWHIADLAGNKDVILPCPAFNVTHCQECRTQLETLPLGLTCVKSAHKTRMTIGS